MKRPITWRRVGKWAGLVSLVAVALAWVGSGYHRIPLTPTDSRWELGIDRGDLVLSYSRLSDMQLIVTFNGKTIEPHKPRWRWSLPRAWYRGTGVAVDLGAVVPLWTVLIVLSLATGLLWRLERRRPGACVSCGYDVAGLPPGSPCPECGNGAAA